MRPKVGTLVLALVTLGCADTVQQRVHEYNQDGVELFRKGAYSQARETFQAALNLKPHDANLLYNVGQCSEHLGQAAQAEQAYHDCLVINPNHTECRHALAVLLWQENKRTEAARMIEDWLSHEPQRAAAYVEHAWYYRQLGDIQRAQSRLQEALRLEPGDVRALVDLGQLYETTNRPERSLVLYERALEIQPDQPEVKLRLDSLKAQGVSRPRPD